MIEVESITNQIINADCMDILKELPDKCIDAIICDLPYGTTACSWDVVIPFDKLWEQYKRIRKDNTPIVLFGSEPFSTYLRMSNIKEYKYDLIWHKNSSGSFVSANKMPMKYHENISVFYKEQPKYNPQFQKYSDSTYKRFKDGEKANRSKQVKNSTNKIQGGVSYEGLQGVNYSRGKYPESVIKIPNLSNNKRIHSTEKPVKLLEYLIKTYSNEGDLILDNCSGSGTTAIACHNLKRRFICIEKDYDYWKASVERLKNTQAQLKLF